jgi:hypothetical protein
MLLDWIKASKLRIFMAIVLMYAAIPVVAWLADNDTPLLPQHDGR